MYSDEYVFGRRSAARRCVAQCHAELLLPTLVSYDDVHAKASVKDDDVALSMAAHVQAVSGIVTGSSLRSRF